MLVTMRDNGEEWGAIRLAWMEETGENPPPSTLPNRYSRIKARLVHLREGDVCLLSFFFPTYDFWLLASFERFFFAQAANLVGETRVI